MRDCGFLGVHIFAAYVNRKASASAQWEGPDVSLLRCKGTAHTISALTQKQPCTDLPVSFNRIGGTLDLKSVNLSLCHFNLRLGLFINKRSSYHF